MTRPKGPKPETGKPLDEAIAEYLLACEVEAKSPRTVQAYAETLRGFRRIVAAGGLPTTVEAFAPGDVYGSVRSQGSPPSASLIRRTVRGC